MMGLEVAPVAPSARFCVTRSGSIESNQSLVPQLMRVSKEDMKGARSVSVFLLRPKIKQSGVVSTRRGKVTSVAMTQDTRFAVLAEDASEPIDLDPGRRIRPGAHPDFRP